MINGLISGRLHGTPEKRIGKNGAPFVVAKVLAASCDAENIIVNVIAFESGTSKALLNLEDGDSVALAGNLTPKVWTDKQGAARPSLDMVAHQILSAYDISRKSNPEDFE
jgi:single-stranded DNA-binding protein